MGNVINQLKAFDYKTRYKAGLLDYDWLFEQSDEGCLYCLDYQEVALILALVGVQRWQTRWFSPSDAEIELTIINELVNRLENDLMTPRCGDLNTNAWSARQSANDILNELRKERYTGDPQSISEYNPTPTQWFNWDGTNSENAALCSAVSAYVALKMLETYNLYLVSASSAAVATGLLFWLGGPLLGIAGGIVTAIAAIGLNNVQAACEDHEALTAISCQLYNSLRGDLIAEQTFYDRINALAGSTANENTIVSVLQAGCNQANYLHFLALLGQAKANADQDMDNCLCEEEWCYVIDFRLSENGFAPVPPYSWGVFEEGVGIVGTTAGTGKAVYWGRTLSQSGIFTSIEMGVVAAGATSGIDLDGTNFGGIKAFQNEESGYVVQSFGGERTATTIDLNPSSGAEQGGEITLQWLRLKGKGTSPFGGSNC